MLYARHGIGGLVGMSAFPSVPSRRRLFRVYIIILGPVMIIAAGIAFLIEALNDLLH